MRLLLGCLVILLSQAVTSQEPTERIILVAGPDGNVIAQLRAGDEIPLRLTDQLGRSIAIRAADPTEGFIEVIDDVGNAAVLGKDAGVWAERLATEETKGLITTIIFQVAKGIAIIVAILVLKSIIEAIGRGVEEEAGGPSRTELLKRVGELEAELADLEVAMTRLSRSS